MKKLLLTGLAITSLIAVNTYAQPIARDATFYTGDEYESLRGNLKPYVSQGQPPYTFAIHGAEPSLPGGGYVHHTDILDVVLIPAEEFDAAAIDNEPGTKSTFQYTATDALGQTSEPATVTIIVGQEKG